ncbi:MAG: tetratricopeptide repeat protein [Deltaproteobacteria bacterium]|nr:tetratricopeptide repeat protein [Deltaproteobacteria bacterium]
MLKGDGATLEVAPEALRTLAHLLADPRTRSFLAGEGLACERSPDSLRAGVGDLRRVVSRVVAHLDDVPPDLRDAPVFAGAGARRLLAQLTTLAAVASDGQVIVTLPSGPPHLRVVEGAADPRAVLASMERVPVERAGELLSALDAMIDEIQLSPALLEQALIPLLEDEQTCGLAARLLGRMGVSAAAPALEASLARTHTLPNRLEILGALLRLGHRVLALRTLRTIMAHGNDDARARAVNLLSELAEVEDVEALHEMMQLGQEPERYRLAAVLYRLGDLRAFAVLTRGLGQLTAQSPPAVALAALDAAAATGSQRFLAAVETYHERETRSWQRARARVVAERLRRRGIPEASPTALIELAEHAWYTGARDEALGHLAELLALDPTHARGLYLRASCLKDEGRVAEALDSAGVALVSEPGNWRLHRLRGSLLWDDGDHEGAVEAYDRALALQPTDAYTWYYKGYVLYRLQRYQEALPCIDRALSLNSDSPYIWNQKAFCLERLERYEEAVACYRRGLKLQPTDIFTREYMGQALQAIGRLEEALVCFDAVLSGSPDREESLYRRADVLYDLERWEESASTFDRFLALRPENYNAWFNRGLCLRFLDRFEEAAECFRRALSLRPGSTNAQRHYEYCLDR